MSEQTDVFFLMGWFLTWDFHSILSFMQLYYLLDISHRKPQNNLFLRPTLESWKFIIFIAYFILREVMFAEQWNTY